MERKTFSSKIAIDSIIKSYCSEMGKTDYGSNVEEALNFLILVFKTVSDYGIFILNLIIKNEGNPRFLRMSSKEFMTIHAYGNFLEEEGRLEMHAEEILVFNCSNIIEFSSFSELASLNSVEDYFDCYLEYLKMAIKGKKLTPDSHYILHLVAETYFDMFRKKLIFGRISFQDIIHFAINSTLEYKECKITYDLVTKNPTVTANTCLKKDEVTGKYVWERSEIRSAFIFSSDDGIIVDSFNEIKNLIYKGKKRSRSMQKFGSKKFIQMGVEYEHLKQEIWDTEHAYGFEAQSMERMFLCRKSEKGYLKIRVTFCQDPIDAEGKKENWFLACKPMMLIFITN